MGTGEPDAAGPWSVVPGAEPVAATRVLGTDEATGNPTDEPPDWTEGLSFWEHPYRVAGMMFLAEAMQHIVDGAVHRDEDSIAQVPQVIVADLVLGAGLCAGFLPLQWWAFPRAAVMVVFGLALWLDGSFGPLELVAGVWTIAVVNLLFGQPTGARVLWSRRAFALWGVLAVLVEGWRAVVR